MQRLYSQLPDFARPTHPVMRYLLGTARRSNLRLQILRFLLAVMVMGVMVLVGYQIAKRFDKIQFDTVNPLDQVFLVLYWPLVTLQILIRLIALGSTSGIIASEIQHGTWDTLKVTTNGAMLTMQTRWAAVFYRLRHLLILIVALRVVFIVIALINLMSYQGNYLRLLLSAPMPFGIANMSKESTILAGIFATSIMMTAALLAPFTAVAFDASIGMLVGTFSQGRFLGILGQVALLIVRLVITVAALELGAIALSYSTISLQELFKNSPGLGWLAALFGVAEGDMGLMLLNLPQHVQSLWADYDAGALVGVAFLGYTLLQAVLANLIVKWAGRRAARSTNAA
ncbi:MAG: hypothetical protein ABI947_21020 [Chloroflexota bacterium]